MCFYRCHFPETLLAIAVTCGASGCGNNNALTEAPRKSTSPPDSQTAQNESDRVKETSVAASDSDSPSSIASRDSMKPTAADLARSSWENPFMPRLWSCDGWRIDEDSMECESADGLPATFLRPYRNVVVECRLTRSQASDTTAAEGEPVYFELRLLEQSTGIRTSLLATGDQVLLQEFVADQDPNPRTLRATARDLTGNKQEVNVRLTMTPNRILIAIDDQMKVNASRPGSMMNAECLVQLIVREQDITLSDLRIEGN